MTFDELFQFIEDACHGRDDVVEITVKFGDGLELKVDQDEDGEVTRQSQQDLTREELAVKCRENRWPIPLEDLPF